MRRTYRVARLERGESYTVPSRLFDEPIRFNTSCGPECVHVVKRCSVQSTESTAAADVAFSDAHTQRPDLLTCSSSPYFRLPKSPHP